MLLLQHRCSRTLHHIYGLVLLQKLCIEGLAHPHHTLPAAHVQSDSALHVLQETRAHENALQLSCLHNCLEKSSDNQDERQLSGSCTHMPVMVSLGAGCIHGTRWGHTCHEQLQDMTRMVIYCLTDRS